MFCTKCGCYVNDKMSFCPKCGIQIKDTATSISTKEAEKPKTDNKKLLNDLSIALPIYKHISNLYDKLIHITFKKEQLRSWMHNSQLLPFIIIGLLFGSIIIMAFLGTPITMIFTSAIMPDILGELFIFSLGIEIFGINYYIKSQETNLQKEIDIINQNIQSYIKQHDCPALYTLPERYRNYVATNFIYECLISGRADTLKEALNLYEQQLHMWEIEENQRKMHNALERQILETERLKRDNDLLSTILLFK